MSGADGGGATKRRGASRGASKGASRGASKGASRGASKGAGVVTHDTFGPQVIVQMHPSQRVASGMR